MNARSKRKVMKPKTAYKSILGRSDLIFYLRKLNNKNVIISFYKKKMLLQVAGWIKNGR